jgi:hypothetical protein
MKTTGRPDIVGIMPDHTGRFLGIEVKRPGEKQRPDQIEFQSRAEKWRGVYIVATSAKEAIEKVMDAELVP